MDKKRKKKTAARITAIVTAVVFMVGAAGILGSYSTNPDLTGNVFAAESRATDMTPEEVLIAAADPAALSDIFVYAPTIYWVDNNVLIFGNGTGLVIYDFQSEKVSSLIDMQAICSGYYNSDSMNTHVIPLKGSEIAVYNTRILVTSDGEEETETEEPYGYYHKFDLSQSKGDGSFLTGTESGDDRDTILGLMKRGEEFESSHYVDAWENIQYVQGPEMTEADNYYGSSYSEYAFVHKGPDGKEYRSILFTKGVKYNEDGTPVEGEPYEYSLLTESADGSADLVHELHLGINDELRAKVKELTKLPEYSYTGSDPAVGVICETIAKDKTSWFGDVEEGSVVIPAPMIYDKIEKNGELLVFGNFWTETYVRQGNTLITTSGGEMPACFHLKATGDTYEIVSVDTAEDGDAYLPSIRKFTEGFPGLYEKFTAENKYDENVRHEMLRAYSEANHLGIKYYKDYGWDPVEL